MRSVSAASPDASPTVTDALVVDAVREAGRTKRTVVWESESGRHIATGAKRCREPRVRDCGRSGEHVRRTPDGLRHDSLPGSSLRVCSVFLAFFSRSLVSSRRCCVQAALRPATVA